MMLLYLWSTGLMSSESFSVATTLHLVCSMVAKTLAEEAIDLASSPDAAMYNCDFREVIYFISALQALTVNLS
jgi:hypothetical protein